MKKVIFILFAFCIFTGIAYSQLNIIDNSREKLWYIVSGSICSPLETCNPESSVVKFGSEVIIDGLTYTTVLKSTDSVFASFQTVGYLRESDRKVYYRPLSRDSDYILYDFNLGLSSKIYLTNTLSNRDSLEYTVYRTDSVFIGSEKRKRIFITGYHNEIWIEGIGSLDGLIFSGMGMDGGFNDLSCYSENGNVIYENPKYTGLHNDENIEKLKIYESQGCLLFELNSRASIIDLYTIDGVFKKSYFVEGCESFTTEKQKPGFYIYQIRDKNQKTILSGKENIR